MRLTARHPLMPLTLLAAGLLSAATAHADITYLGAGGISATALDTSGLTDTVTWPAGSMPHNQVGGFGSAITWSGWANRYIATPDRGPGDGLVSNYYDRFYEIDVSVKCPSGSCGTGGWTVGANLAATRLMTTATGAHLNGNSGNIANGLRFDPEGVRTAANGKSIYVSDEYGPTIYEFDRATGKALRTITVPAKFLVANPSADGAAELPPGNTSGRQANRGMEGLAISPDGSKLYGIMQSPLIQDGALNSSNSRRGVNNRMLEIDLATGVTREFVYQMASNRSDGVTSSLGVSEMVAVNDHQFLVLERDGDSGTAASFKDLYMIDIAAAADVSGVAALPQKLSDALPSGVTAVTKTAFLDFLDPAFGLAGTAFPEKLEGLAFGPDFANGDHLLLVTVDNDFATDKGNTIYAFRIGAGDLPGYQAQRIAPVPEPETYAMMLAGLGLLGAVARRRRS